MILLYYLCLLCKDIADVSVAFVVWVNVRDVSKVRVCCVWPKFHLARLDSTRHVRLCRASRASRASRDERVERDEPRCFNMADDERATVFACTSLVVFYALAYTNPICFVK